MKYKLKNSANTYKTLILFNVLLVLCILSCDEKPPVTPYPDVIGFKVNGNAVLDYLSEKGVIHTLSGDVYLFQFSSTASINKESYSIVISVFPKDASDTTTSYTFVKPGTESGKKNYAFALFMTGWDTERQVEYWATSGNITFSTMNIGQGYHSIKGIFNFEALSTKGTDTLRVSVSDGWVDYSRIL